MNPYAPSRASIARCSSATGPPAAVPASAAVLRRRVRGGPAVPVAPTTVVCIAWSRAAAAAASRASSTGPRGSERSRGALGGERPETPGPPRGQTQSHSTHSASRLSVAARRAFANRSRLCACVKASSLSSSERNSRNRTRHLAPDTAPPLPARAPRSPRSSGGGRRSRRSAFSRRTRACSLGERSSGSRADVTVRPCRARISTASARRGRSLERSAGFGPTLALRQVDQPSAGASARGAASAASARAARAASLRAPRVLPDRLQRPKVAQGSETAPAFHPACAEFRRRLRPRAASSPAAGGTGDHTQPSNPPPSPRPRHPSGSRVGARPRPRRRVSRGRRAEAAPVAVRRGPRRARSDLQSARRRGGGNLGALGRGGDAAATAHPALREPSRRRPCSPRGPDARPRASFLREGRLRLVAFRLWMRQSRVSTIPSAST